MESVRLNIANDLLQTTELSSNNTILQPIEKVNLPPLWPYAIYHEYNELRLIATFPEENNRWDSLF